jgi:hypothetical protein
MQSWTRSRASLLGPRLGVASRLAVLVLALGTWASSSESSASRETPLSTGDDVPKLSYVDIDGESSATDAYPGWIQVITFADRESSEPMKEWLSKAQVRAMQAHPELAVAYIGFADLSAVPGFLRGLVKPVLRKTFENSNEGLAETYRKAGVEPDPSKVAFRFTPDWDGSYLKAFGLDNAASYYCWIVSNGVVVASLDASTPDIVERYLEAFNEVASARAAAAR